MLHESQRLKRVSKANGVSVVAQVEVDVKVSADNYWTAVGHELLKHRRQFVAKLGRQRGTSRPVDVEQHQLTVSRRRIAVQVLECRRTVIENSLLEPGDVTVNKGEATVILEVDSVGGCVPWYRSCSFYTPIPRRRKPIHNCRLWTFMPGFSNDEDVQSRVDDFVVGGACIHTADDQGTIIGDAGAKTSAGVSVEQAL